jgi:hypothetical protein
MTTEILFLDVEYPTNPCMVLVVYHLEMIKKEYLSVGSGIVDLFRDCHIKR